MNTRLTIENIGAGKLLCTLEIPMGNRESLHFALEHPKDTQRTTSQLEYQLLQKMRDRLSELCIQHPEHKRA